MTSNTYELFPDEARARGMRAAAVRALEHVEPGSLLGVGTGATVGQLIELLATSERRPAAAVASSRRTAHLLLAAGIDVVPLPESGRVPLYIDGADEVDPALRMVKGGGGAHAREKVLACAAELFVCIVDDSKMVPALGSGPVPVEVLPFARYWVARRLSELGGRSAHRVDFVTDNGNELLDVHGLDLSDPCAVECAIACIPGVVACGIFARRPADVAYVGDAAGAVVEMRPPTR
jgi:ribose 5-phosphate isomerase A